MTNNGFLAVPPGVLRYTCPDDYVLERDKNTQWWTDYIRWSISVGYNQPRPSFKAGTPQIMRGRCDEAIDNWSYVFGEQVNDTFAYAETDIMGNTIPAVWIAGDKVAQLFKHIKGRLLEDISNLEISAENLSHDVRSKRGEMIEKLVLKHKVDALLKQAMPDGVDFNPMGGESETEFTSVEDIETYVSKWQDKYTILVEKMSQNIVDFDYLKHKLLSNGAEQVATGLSGMLTEVVNGRPSNQHIPNWKLIWDNRVDDEFNAEAWFCGVMEPKVPYQKIIQMFGKDFTKEEIDEIRALSDPKNFERAAGWSSYYNGSGIAGSSPIWWSNWGTSDMCVSYARVWWIGPRDYRYKQTYDKNGVPRYKKIKDDDLYPDSNGVPKQLKGSDVPGDFVGYDIHTGILVGNKYLIRHGYANNIVRPLNKLNRPELPIRIFCSDMTLGGNKCLVSRLKAKQKELDRLSYKIQELTAKDNGKVYIINGNKLDVTSTELLSDVKIMGIHVTRGTTGEPDDPTNGQRLVEVIDMTLDPNIIRYIDLKNEQKQEMDEIASVSKISLGQNQNTIGKGVQQNTINQNSYGLAGMFYGLMHHYERIIQYNVNLQQLLWTMTDTTEEDLVIGDEGSQLLDTLDLKEFGTQLMKVRVKLSDFMDIKQKERIQSVGLAAAQNRELPFVDYVEYVEFADTPTQMKEGLKRAYAKREKLMQAQQAAQSQQAMQHEASLAEQKALNEAALIQLEENSKNWRAAVDALKEDIQALAIMLQAVPTTSPLMNQLEQANMAAEQQQQAPQEQVAV